MPASTATAPAPVRNEGSLTSSASSRAWCRRPRPRARAARRPRRRGARASTGSARRAPSGARDPERRPDRVQRQQEDERPQPAGRRLVARRSPDPPPARTIATVRSRRGERVLLVVHARLAVAEPRALHATRVRARARRPPRRTEHRSARPAMHVARSASGPRRSASRGSAQRGPPQAGEALVHHAVPAAARLVRARARARPTARSAG